MYGLIKSGSFLISEFYVILLSIVPFKVKSNLCASRNILLAEIFDALTVDDFY